MAVFNAQRALNFHTMDYLDTLLAPAGDYSGDVDSFYVFNADTIQGEGTFVNVAGTRPTSGVISSLEVEHGTIFPENAFTISAMNTDFNGLIDAVQNGAAEDAGIAFILKGNDTVYGSSGNDLLDGYAGSDTIKGAGGADRLFGGTGGDQLQGGDGKDFIDGGIGSDLATYEDKGGDVSVKLKGSTVVKVKVDGKVRTRSRTSRACRAAAATTGSPAMRSPTSFPAAPARTRSRARAASTRCAATAGRTCWSEAPASTS